MSTKKQKNRKKRPKKRNRILKVLGLVALLILLLLSYHLYKSGRTKNLTEISIRLDQLINEKFREYNIGSSQITEKFQTEEKNDDKEWIKYTKKISVSESVLPGIVRDIEEIAGKELLQVLHKKETSRKTIIKIGLKRNIILNQIVFELSGKKSLLAIVVDDLGYTKNIRSYLELDIPLTYAIMPELPYSTMLAEEFERSGISYILHMPMEPEGYPEKNPGDTALLVDMDKRQIVSTLESALKSVKNAAGLNNHMGSKFTSDTKKMKILIDILRKKQLFFVDSATSKDSVGYAMALQHGVPAIKNNFYIDNKDDYKYLLGRIKELIAFASKREKTVAICHITRKNTPKALKYYVNKFNEANIEFVPVEDLLE